MAVEQKDTIYIDVDDEITAIIDKVQASDSKIVALVLPKRATTLQSIVNMKLLKRSAEDEGKHVVLITSEVGLLPIAGVVGIYTAKTLQSKPEIPDVPDMNAPEESVASIDGDEPLDPAKPIGELAGDTVEIDNDEPAKPAAPKKKGPKHPKIPNFEKFRMKLFIGGGAILVVLLLWYVAVFMAGSARITIKTNAESVNASTDFTADPSITQADIANKQIPAEQVETKKEDSQKVNATGEKDVGEKATGSLAMSSTICNSLTPPKDVAAGTKVTANKQTYLTQDAVSFSFDTISGGCVHYKSNGTTITAQNSGTDSNTSSTSFAVTGHPDVSATGSATGGTTKIVKIVTQQDVDDAKAKLDTGHDAISEELKGQLEQKGDFAITESLHAKDEKTNISPGVGEQGDDVTVTYSATFTMLGVHREDMKALLTESIKDQIDVEKQEIQDDGLDQATFNLKKAKSDGSASMSVSTVLAVGPNIDTDKLKADVAGKKRGDTENIVKALPSVNDVTVDYSPFWVSSTPKKADKITIIFEKAE
jgi:hypothetical protein